MPIKTATLHTIFRPAYAFWILISVVTTLLLMEHHNTVAGFPHMDKIIHAALFVMLTAFGYWAYSTHRLWLYAGLITYGGATELLQGAFTMSRFASIYDWIADIVGILLCVFVIKMMKTRTIPKTPYVN